MKTRILVRSVGVVAGLAAMWTFLAGPPALRPTAIGAGGLVLLLLAAGLRKRRAATEAKGAGKAHPSDPAAVPLLGSLRRESDILASSFDEDALLLAVVEQLDQGAFSGAVRSIRGSLRCSSADAALLAHEVERAVRRVRAAAGPASARAT